ncbi:MAG: hypothetical protein EX270_00985, partial [Pseudomonadales bacterium]
MLVCQSCIGRGYRQRSARLWPELAGCVGPFQSNRIYGNKLMTNKSENNAESSVPESSTQTGQGNVEAMDKLVTLKELPSMGSLLLGIGKTLVKKGKGTRLPEATFAYNNQRIDREHLNAYRKICKFESTDALPLTYLHVLAFRMQLAMLLDESCDFPLLGLVHIHNDITRHKALPMDARYDFKCRFEPIANHRKGKLISTVLEAFIDEELVWEDRSINLCRMKNENFDNDAAPAFEPLPVGRKPVASVAEPWKLPADLGRRYGKISGDRNPIHTRKFTARMLGFKKQIAHGMWSKGR